MKKRLVTAAALGTMAFALLARTAWALPTYYGWQQWTGSDANDHWYQVVDTHNYTTWQMAVNQAANLGGYLATVTSAAENTFVYENLGLFSKGAQAFYLGGYQPDYIKNPGLETNPAAGWAWVTGEEWKYTNWNPAGNPDINYGQEPNNCGPDCVAQNFLHYYPASTVSDSHWDDVEERQNYMYGFVVERNTTPVPEPASMLLLGSGLVGAAWLRRRR